MDVFCSDQVAEIGEPLIGTTPRAQHSLLLGRPKGSWGAKALQAPELAAVAGWVRDRNARGARLDLRLFARDSDQVEVRLFPAGVRVLAPTLETLPARLEEIWERIDTQRPLELAPAPRTLAICTHGKHDRCCAKHGQALYEATRALVPPDWDVLEASHLGGHRFAATALDLAPGRPARMYGRLRAEEAERWVGALRADRVWLARYRGRADLSSAEQVAEAQAIALGAPGWVDVEPLSDGRFKARWADGETIASVAERSFRGPKGCGKADETWSRVVLAQASG